MSNGCATNHPGTGTRGFAVVLAGLAVFSTAASSAAAQDAAQPAAPNEHHGSTVGPFLLGGAAGLAAHESGHLLFDAIFDANPGIARVSFHGIPFFAITHDSGLSDRQEFVIDSAGFWVQHASNELILHAHPRLRDEHQPFLKGMYAFNVLASVARAPVPSSAIRGGWRKRAI